MVTWEFKPTRWGMYDVELSYESAGGKDTELEVGVAGKMYKVAVAPTGGAEQYATLPIGQFYLGSLNHLQCGWAVFRQTMVQN